MRRKNLIKVILKDNSIYSVGSWDSEKNRWICQNIRTEENRLFEPGDIMKVIDVSPEIITDLKC